MSLSEPLLAVNWLSYFIDSLLTRDCENLFIALYVNAREYNYFSNMKRLTIFLSTLFLAISVQAQNNTQDSTTPKEEQTENTVPPLRLKPRLGLGVGTFTFFGEVGGDTRAYSPLSSNFGYHIRLSNELSPYFDLSLQAIFGSFTVNEINTDRRFNFRSEVRTAGVHLSYNFAHFLPQDRFIEPWISVGIESFEYLSKSDLYDAQGNLYHYWSDGSIRSIAQNAANASDAIMLERDYRYETDLRELNADGLGRYQERNWAIPVGAGINMRMTNRFRARLGATMHFTFTDLIDNMSTAGEGDRLGDIQNDRFMYASLALNYDLSTTPKAKPEPFEFMDENGELISMNLDDWDKDGVTDLEDECPGTPEGAPVDEKGCPLDSDGDGFADYMDAEPNSSAGAVVDAEGVMMSDDQIETRYLAWTDSIPWIQYAGAGSFAENFATINADPTRLPEDPAYTVQIGVTDRGLTQAEINALLALQDVKSLKRDGEDVYVVGSYEELPDAVQRKMELDQQGINGAVRFDDGESLMNVDAKATAMENKLRSSSTQPALANNENVIYRVQLGAFRFRLNENIFAGIPDVVAIKGDDDLTRYVTGTFNSAQEAAAYKSKIYMEGFEDAFITAYRSGDRITLANAGMTLTKDAEDLVVDKVSNSVNKELISFRVLLAGFENTIPTDVLSSFLELGNVSPVRESDGVTKYLHGRFKTLKEAQEALSRVHDEGLPGAVIIGDFNGKLVPADQAVKLLNDENDEVSLPKKD